MILTLDKEELATLKVVIEAWEKKNVFVTRNEPNKTAALNRLWRKVVAETLEGLEDEKKSDRYEEGFEAGMERGKALGAEELFND